MDERLKNIPAADLENITGIVRCFVEAVHPLKIYLFGSFADGTFDDDSDYDFYIVVEDGRDTAETSLKARSVLWGIMDRPVDVIIGSVSRFSRYGQNANSFYIESEVYSNGILFYDSGFEKKIAV